MPDLNRSPERVIDSRALARIAAMELFKNAFTGNPPEGDTLVETTYQSLTDTGSLTRIGFLIERYQTNPQIPELQEALINAGPIPMRAALAEFLDFYLALPPDGRVRFRSVLTTRNQNSSELKAQKAIEANQAFARIATRDFLIRAYVAGTEEGDALVETQADILRGQMGNERIEGIVAHYRSGPGKGRFKKISQNLDPSIVKLKMVEYLDLYLGFPAEGRGRFRGLLNDPRFY